MTAFIYLLTGLLLLAIWPICWIAASMRSPQCYQRYDWQRKSKPEVIK